MTLRKHIGFVALRRHSKHAWICDSAASAVFHAILKAIASLGGVAFATVVKAAVSRYTVFILNEN